MINETVNQCKNLSEGTAKAKKVRCLRRETLVVWPRFIHRSFFMYHLTSGKNLHHVSSIYP